MSISKNCCGGGTLVCLGSVLGEVSQHRAQEALQSVEGSLAAVASCSVRCGVGGNGFSNV